MSREHETADDVLDGLDVPAYPFSGNGHSGLSEREKQVAELARDISIEDEAQKLAREHTAPEPKPLVVRDADLSESRPPKFAWDGRFLLGSLNLILGFEGVGKSTLAAALIARWTRGKLPGALHGKRVNVAVVGDEDSWTDSWVPRLYAAGADLGRVKLIERPDGGYVELRRDREKLEDAVDLHGIRVVYLDALLDNLGVATNDWRAKAVRDALQPARLLARELEVAVIGSLHPNKSRDAFRNVVAGSFAFNAVSRSSLLLARDPDEDGRVVLVRGKGNQAATPEAVTFEIESYKFTANGHKFDMPKAVGFRKGGTLTADDLLAAAAESAGAGRRAEKREVTQAGRLEQLICDRLPADGGWHEARPIIDACTKQEDCDRRRVTEAADRLGILKRKSGFQGGAEWSWPSTGAVATPHTGDGPTSPTSPTVQKGSQAKGANKAAPATGKKHRPTGKAAKQEATR